MDLNIMSKIKYYQQCELERKEKESTIHTVAYIPEEFAAVGKVVKIKDKENDTWQDGWKVTFSSSEKVEASIVETRERDYTKQRKASDI